MPTNKQTMVANYNETTTTTTFLLLLYYYNLTDFVIVRLVYKKKCLPQTPTNIYTLATCTYTHTHKVPNSEEVKKEFTQKWYKEIMKDPYIYI